MRYRGWSLTAWNSVLLLAMSAAVLATTGTGEDGIRVLIRATARTSALLFLATFVARPAHQLWRSDVTAFLLRNRRHLGVSMAASHAIHGAAIVWLANAHPASFAVDAATLLGGGLGFVFIAGMAATSSDAAVASLGRRPWQWLHRAGAWTLWVIFTVTFVPDPSYGWDALHAGALAAFLAALLLRVAARLRARRRQPAPA